MPNYVNLQSSRSNKSKAFKLMSKKLSALAMENKQLVR